MKRAYLAMSAAFVSAALPAATSPSYHVAEQIAGPDGAGWDYASVDPTGQRVYVTHGDAVTEMALENPHSVRSLGTIEHGHAAVAIPHTTLLLVTSGHDGTVRLIDTRTGTETAKIAVGANPDAAILDPVTGHALVMNAESGSVSEIDIAGRKVFRTIPVKPALEYAAIGRGRTLFVNDEDANEIEVVDLTTGKVGAPIPLPGCEGPTGLAFDAVHDRLISACANGKAAVVDATTRQVTLLAIGRGPDAVLLDAKRRLAFIPCGRDGVLEVLSLDAPGGVRRIDTIKTEIGARTGAIDPATGAIYLPTARFGPPPAPGKRAPALPGSFHILVVRRS